MFKFDFWVLWVRACPPAGLPARAPTRSPGGVAQGYVPAWALVFIFGLTTFITLRKVRRAQRTLEPRMTGAGRGLRGSFVPPSQPACLAALVASLLYLVAALLTQPPTDNLLMVRTCLCRTAPAPSRLAALTCTHGATVATRDRPAHPTQDAEP